VRKSFTIRSSKIGKFFLSKKLKFFKKIANSKIVQARLVRNFDGIKGVTRKKGYMEYAIRPHFPVKLGNLDNLGKIEA